MKSYILETSAVPADQIRQFNFAIDTLLELPRFREIFFGALAKAHNNITITVVDDQTINHGSSGFDPGAQNIIVNFWGLKNFEYRGIDGGWHRFSLQTTLAHEFFHAFDISMPFPERAAIQFQNEIAEYFGEVPRAGYRFIRPADTACVTLYDYPVFNASPGEHVKLASPNLKNADSISTAFNAPG